MDARVDLRPSLASHRSFRLREQNEAAIEAGPGRLGLLTAQAVWLGLLGAWLELTVLLGHRAIVGTVTRVSYRQNWYRVPLSFPAHLAILGAWLAVAALLARRPARAGRVDPAMTFLAWFLALVSPLLAIEELYWPCGVVLAAGLAARLSPWWRRRRGAILRKTLPILGLGSFGIMVGSFWWLRTAEARMLAALPPAVKSSPNVVLLVLDTVRADHLSLYGYARTTTPHLEAMASRSVVFDLARAPAPWTLPSHASIFTGRWPHDLSVDTDRPLDATYPTIAGFLSDHGYATGGFTGNTFYTNAWFGLDRGFAHYEDATENRTISVQETLRCAALARMLMPVTVALKIWPSTAQFPARKRAEWLRRDAMTWLDGLEPTRPFFLFLNFFDAHDPYLVPAKFPVQYSWDDRAALHQANRRYNGHAAEDDARPATGQPAADPELTRVVMDAYDDCLRYVDDQIARLMADLEHRGRGRDTWIIVTADHGEQFGDHGFYRHGGSLYRGEIDVPLLIVPPSGSGEEARRIASPVSPRDLPATVADLAGLTTDSPFPGRSLRSTWDGSSAESEWGDAPLSELKIPADHLNGRGGPGLGNFRTSVVSDNRIYHGSVINADELYDVKDRDEASNLATKKDSASVLASFHRYLDRLTSRK